MRVARRLRKSIDVFIMALLVALPLQGIGSAKLLADAGTWVDGDMPQVIVGDTVPAVSSPCFSGEFLYQSFTKADGSFSSIPRDLKANVCMTQNNLGFYGDGLGSANPFSYGMIRPNTTYAYPVFDAAGLPSGVVPVPGQKGFIFAQNESSLNGGRALRFYASFSAAGTFQPVYGSSNVMGFRLGQLTQPLKDSVGDTLHMMNGYAFSPNGQWMLAEIEQLGILRINTQTQEMLLIDASYYQYGQGYSPVVSLGISDDGQSALRSDRDADTRAYDLSGCQAVAFTIGSTANTTPGCHSRSIKQSISVGLNGFRGLFGVCFRPHGKSVKGVASRITGAGANELRHTTISVAGYQPPQTSYIALGDSFSSGEGALTYEPGTNQAENKCHLSKKSYPYKVAETIGLSEFHNVACSGARVENYKNSQVGIEPTPDSPLGNFLPGFRGQQEYFRFSGNPSAVTISMIGNDIGFSNKIQRCVLWADPCFHFREDRESIAYEIYSKFDILVDLYEKIQLDSGNAKVYVLGYPQLAGDGPACDLNFPLDPEERQLAQGLVTYLNAVIKAATEKSGVQYIDVEQAFVGHKACEQGQPAVNGVTAGDDIVLGIGPLGNESFHPTALGQELMAQALLVQSDGLTKPMPILPSNAQTDNTKKAPYVGSNAYNTLLGNAPSGGTFHRAVYSSIGGLNMILKGSGTPFNDFNHIDTTFEPNSQVRAELHSTPTQLGTFQANAEGGLSGRLVIPDSVEPGYHTLHFFGRNIAGEQIDLYKTIYVAENLDDYDGDGIPNADEKCLATEPANIDQDRDNVDDACDGEITEPPADSTPPTVTGSPDRQPDYNGWYNRDVTISWLATDPEPSSGLPTQPTPTLISQEGRTTITSSSSCDPLNNCSTGSVDIMLDKTAPILGIPAWTLNPKPTTGTASLIVPATDTLSDIEEAEYFLGDTDPGIGNGATMYISSGGFTTSLGTDFPTGVYKISVRAKDRAGNWSQAVSDYLVVYDQATGTRMTGKRTLIPSLAKGDSLPGLLDAAQTDKAKFGFNIRYDNNGQIHPNSDFQFEYQTGTKCSNPAKSQGCHTFQLNAASIAWLTTQGSNQSLGTFQGTGEASIDGAVNQVNFQVKGLDAERLGASSPDSLELLIFKKGDDPHSATPIYRVNGEVLRGSIKIDFKGQ